ncbi:hypothetical protein [Aestuariivirga sp.]|uniref:hypothetical protein n=1 Tax=Aestuariivirga sp. TaxID=2650926 RepID=UPI003BAD796E
MTRYALIVLAAMGAVASAAAFQQAPAGTVAEPGLLAANQTVVAKNSPFPVIGPLVVEQCKVEDCSDTE